MGLISVHFEVTSDVLASLLRLLEREEVLLAYKAVSKITYRQIIF